MYYNNNYLLVFSNLNSEQELSLAGVLKRHYSEVLNNDSSVRQRVTVRRGHIFNDAKHAVSTLDETKHLRITFLGESAVDDGGPRRQFFMLLMGAIGNNGSILDGPPKKRLLGHNADAFEVRNSMQHLIT